jgi:hypothetical protein
MINMMDEIHLISIYIYDHSDGICFISASTDEIMILLAHFTTPNLIKKIDEIVTYRFANCSMLYPGLGSLDKFRMRAKRSKQFPTAISIVSPKMRYLQQL